MSSPGSILREVDGGEPGWSLIGDTPGSRFGYGDEWVAEIGCLFPLGSC